MSSVSIEVDEQPLERVRADAVVVGYSPDDRPLRGAASRADWRLCGELWRLVAARKLNGALGRAALVSAAGPLRAPLLLVVGLGHRADLAVDTWRQLGSDILRRVLDLEIDRVVLGLASDAAILGPAGTRALIAGAAAATAERSAKIRLVLVGDDALERLAELSPLAESGLPAGTHLRLPDSFKRAARNAPGKSGGFTTDQGLQFK